MDTCTPAHDVVHRQAPAGIGPVRGAVFDTEEREQASDETSALVRRLVAKAQFVVQQHVSADGTDGMQPDPRARARAQPNAPWRAGGLMVDPTHFSGVRHSARLAVVEERVLFAPVADECLERGFAVGRPAADLRLKPGVPGELVQEVARDRRLR